MKIMICDDCEADRQHLATMLQKYCTSHFLEAEVQQYQSCDELLRRFPLERPQIVFLDILMQGTTGVQAAYAIRGLNPDCIVLFTTITSSYMLDGFEVGAAHYLLKPVSEKKLTQAMDRCIQRMGGRDKTLQTFFRRHVTTTKYDDILYIEVFDKLCYIHVQDGVVKTYCTLDDLESRLEDKRFLRCHRSYLVNMQKVKSLSKGFFILQNDQQVPISRTKKQWIKDSYADYLVSVVED